MTIFLFTDGLVEEVFLPMDSNDSFFWGSNTEESLYRVADT